MSEIKQRKLPLTAPARGWGNLTKHHPAGGLFFFEGMIFVFHNLCSNNFSDAPRRRTISEQQR